MSLWARKKEARARPGGVIRAGNTEQRPSGLTCRLGAETENNGLRECSIFSWEIQSTFVLMADPLIKLSLSPSGQTICKVKCVTLCITSHRHVLPTRFNVKGGHQYCHIKTIYSFINWQYRVFCSVSLLVLGFYNNSWPVLVGKLVGRLAVICVSVWHSHWLGSRPISLTMPRIWLLFRQEVRTIKISS